MRVDAVVTLREEELSQKQWQNLFRSLTFEDNDGTIIQAYDHRSGRHEVVLPRGALDLVNVPVEVQDMRSKPAMPKLRYVKELDANGFQGQKEAVRTMFAKQQGQLRMPTGSGKTSVGLAFAAASCTRTLVLVHTKDLMRQWIERAEEEIPGIEVGVVHGARCEIGQITVAMAQTIKRYLGAGGAFWRQFGCVIIDESAHSAAETWEWILNVCPAYYRFGLSASDKRSDGRMPLVRFNVGPVIYRQKFRPQVTMPVDPVLSEFRSRYNATQWTKLVAELVRDDARNQMIGRIVAAEIEAGNTVLVLSRQIKHLQLIAEHLPPSLEGKYKVVTGHLPQRQRNAYIAALADGSLRAILGTQLFEEGVDIPRINRVVLAFPGTDVTTLQKVGRGARKFEGKTECRVIDIVDHRVAVLVRQWTQRKTWYRSVSMPIGKFTNPAMIASDEGRPDGTEKGKGRTLLDSLRVRRR